MKKAVILINEISSEANSDELDVLDQACLVEDALAEMGFETERLFLNLDLKDCLRKIRIANPDFVFNLVETVDGKSSLAHLAPSLLESYSISFTGCGSESMFITTNKLLTKQFLTSYGIPTPLWNEGAINAPGDKKLIYKPVSEEASVGINDKSVVIAYFGQVLPGNNIPEGIDFFVEEYIHGREFNISVIEGINGPEVLPPAEILFTDYPPDKPQIVGYSAKWDEDSFEYNNTPRSFEFSKEDEDLISRLKDISIKCWNDFGLKGYARIDFRIDENALAYVIEINANPCIAPDSGFIAACRFAGMDDKDIIGRIISNSI
jgi:D-alanine-D-alanine ligase